MHHYQRGQASIMWLMVELREIIETGRLVVVVMARLVRLSSICLKDSVDVEVSQLLSKPTQRKDTLQLSQQYSRGGTTKVEPM